MMSSMTIDHSDDIRKLSSVSSCRVLYCPALSCDLIYHWLIWLIVVVNSIILCTIAKPYHHIVELNRSWFENQIHYQFSLLERTTQMYLSKVFPAIPRNSLRATQHYQGKYQNNTYSVNYTVSLLLKTADNFPICMLMPLINRGVDARGIRDEEGGKRGAKN